MNRQPFDPQTMPLHGLRLIEASAGTGKTFSLAGLYLRLLVEQKLAVREILVMTFTRAATQELRERIRQRLVDAASIAREPAREDYARTEDAFAAALIAASDEPREAVARRLAEAAQRMDEALIATIHGYAQRAAAENAFASALPFDRGEQVDDGPLYREAVGDYWRARACGDAYDAAFVDWWPGPEKLGKALSEFRRQPHARPAGPSAAEIEVLAKQLRARWAAEQAVFAAAWNRCWAEELLYGNRSLHRQILRLGGIDEALAELRGGFETARPVPRLPDWVAHLRDPDKQFKPKRVDEGKALLDQPLARELQRLKALEKSYALQQALSEIQGMVAERKQRRRQYSYADQIGALHAAITAADGGPRLATALHAAWPWALVDEFQDTDPLQYEILQRIYAGRERGGLILIGDPKQAIFGFRGGDVYAYLTAAADAGGSAYSLDRNFRSTQAVLDGIEALFSMPGADPFLVAGIDYPHVTAGRGDQRRLEQAGETLPALGFWHLAPDPPNKAAAERACRDACVARIRELLDPEHGARIVEGKEDATDGTTRPLAPRDIAVLVNTNIQAGQMQRALSAVGVPAACLHRDSVYASDEAVDLLHLLKAAASPTDEGLIRGALTGELLGQRLSDLIALQGDETQRQEATDRFQRAHERWREYGVLAMLQPLIQEAAPRLLGYVDGERRISNYLQLAELLAAVEGESFGMTGLLQRLRRAHREAVDGSAGEIREAEQLRLESDEALVRIATVHKAKGLEYPVVFLPFAPWLGAQGQPGQPPLKFHDDDQRARIAIDPDNAAKGRAIHETRAEGLRQLYVALTRAELACFLPWGAANGASNGALASLLHRDTVAPESWAAKGQNPLDNAIAHRRLEELAARAPQAITIEPWPGGAAPPGRLPASAAEVGEARRDLPAPRPDWSVFSFTRLVRAAGPALAAPGADDESEPTAPEGEPAALPELPGGSAFGSAVHALLETAEPADWPAPPAPLPADRREDVQRALLRHGITLPPGRAGDAMAERSSELVRAALHTPLPDIGPLAALPPAARLTEMEFVLRLGGSAMGELLELLDTAGYARQLPRERLAERLRGLMHGYIDLIVERDGRYFVIDHKTNWLGPQTGDYAPPALQAAIDRHHYDLQYLIYLTALHRHLRRRLPGYEPARQLGGVRYLFLRGMAPAAGERGIFCDRPDPALIQRLDGLLDGETA